MDDQGLADLAWTAPRTFVFHPETIRRYADATHDDSPWYRRGLASVPPPLFGFLAGWDALTDAVTSALGDGPVRSIVHVGQCVVNHRFPRAGDATLSRARVASIRTSALGATLVTHVEVSDVAGDCASESWSTLLVAGSNLNDTAGPSAPSFRSDADGEPTTFDDLVDDDLPDRYAAVSGDRNPIHLDDQAARMAGLPGRVVHGMCTLAIALRHVVTSACDGDPARISTVSAKFARPVLVAQVVRTKVWTAREGAGFRVDGPSGVAIKHGVVLHR